MAGSGWRTQRGGDGLWNGAGHAAASRPHKVVAADPATPHSRIDKLGETVEERNRPSNPGLQLGEIKPQTTD